MIPFLVVCTVSFNASWFPLIHIQTDYLLVDSAQQCANEAPKRGVAATWSFSPYNLDDPALKVLCGSDMKDCRDLRKVGK